MDGANTAWILTSTALVLFMTLPGLALFYAGLVRSQNVLSVLMHCFSIACLISILWLLLGYSLAFDDGTSWIGGLQKALLTNVGKNALSGDIPETVFFMFQMTFAIITPALIVGAYPERIKFSAGLCKFFRLTACTSRGNQKQTNKGPQLFHTHQSAISPPVYGVPLKPQHLSFHY